MNLTWKKNTGQFASGETAFRGKVAAFKSQWRTIKTDNQWILYCSLPGIKDRIGDFDTEDDYRKRAEEVFAYWLKITNLTANP